MKAILGLILLAVACMLSAHAAAPPSGKPQNLTSPDQVPEGLAKSDWSSIRAAYEAGRHAFMPIEGGWQARNPGQQWTTKFDRRGFLAQPREAEWQWGLELRSYGFGDKQTAIGGTPAVKADGQRLSYQWDATVQEWFVNDQRGLEHGFTVARRPECGTGVPPVGLTAETAVTLSFTLGVRGTLKPQITADAQGVLFLDASGATVLNYTGLKVWDADGKVLPSRFEMADSQASVRLLVEERGARYPLTIDPIAHQAYLKAGNNGVATMDGFGRSVAVSGDTVVVGAPSEDSSTTGVDSTPDELSSDSGAAYVFVRSAGVWSQQAYLKPAAVGTTQVGDAFGISVAIAGDTVVVGAYLEASSTTGVNSTPNELSSDSGTAYVFVRNGTIWSQQAYLKPTVVGTTQAGDFFGFSVAVSGDTVVVGALNEDSSTLGAQVGGGTPDENANSAGAAYVFVRTGTTWSQQAYLKPAAADTTQVGDAFGISVAVSGETVVVGASAEDSSTTGVQAGAGTPNESATNAGAAYVFVRNAGVWTQQAYLKPSAVGTAQVGDLFGSSVAVSGDTVVVGAPQEDGSSTGVNSTPDEIATDAGATYVFVRSAGLWTQQAYLKPDTFGQTQADDLFGRSVAISGDTLVVGAIGEDSSTTGVDSAPDEGSSLSGAAYVFARNGVMWTQQAYIKAAAVGTTQADDRFGTSVAISGDTVVVGASLEDSSSTGVNSTPNETASAAGAAYVFVRSGATWAQQTYLKASNTPTGPTSPFGPGVTDQFGISVAVAGDTVVVGANQEDSNSTSINSIPNELANNAGAAYIFVRSGATWAQQAYLKPASVGASQAGDGFGISVAVWDDTVVVGASFEDSGTTGVNSTPNESASAAGAAYVFVRSGTVWTQQAYLKPAAVGTSQVNDRFGISVAVSNDTVVVGANLEDSSTVGVNSTPDEQAALAGAAYVFARSGSTWTQQAYLKPAAVGTTQTNDQFGRSVAVSGDTIVVGAISEDSSTVTINSTPNESANGAGAAYVFTRSGTTWTQQAYLKPAAVGTSQAGDGFGISVAVFGGTAVVGSQFEDSNTTGVNSTPNESASAAGAAYIFVRNGTTWTQQAYLKPASFGTTQVSDQFGSSLSISEDTVVVGAPFEDSNSTGVNSTPNESAINAGAVYVFTRNGTTWTQQAYLKSTAFGISQAADQFGFSVAVSGGMAVVGAQFEDSSTIGADSSADELASDSGAVMIFTGFPASDINVTQISPVADGDSVDFGSVMVGSSSAAKSFTITNPGTANLTSLALSGGTSEFSVSALSGTSIPVGASTVTFSVTFTPNAAGARTAALQIASNVTGAKSLFDISLAGQAFLPQDTDVDGLLDSWELSHWPSITGHNPLDDDDHDGLVNLLELGFGLNPTLPNGAALPPVTTEGNYLTLTLIKRPGVTFEVQSAGSLLPALQDSFSATSTTVLINDATTLKVRDNFLIGSSPPRFMRVKVTAAP